YCRLTRPHSPKAQDPCPMRGMAVEGRSVAGVFCAAIAVVCGGCDFGVPPGAHEGVSYSREVQPLFNARCASSGCHGSVSPASDLELTSWESVMRGSHHGAMVIPFRPDRSHLIFHVNHDTTRAPVAHPSMPPDQPLPDGEVELLMQWIREGARNDRGEIPFSHPRDGVVLVTNQAEDEITVIDIETNLIIRMVSVGNVVSPLSPPESPHNVVFSPDGQHYFVNLIVGNEIWKFRTSDHGVAGTVALGTRRAPAQIVLTSDGTKAFVSNFDLTAMHQGIQVFDPRTMDAIQEIRDQRIVASHGVQLTHGETELWTANQLSDNLAIVDVNTHAVLAVVKVDSTVPDLPTGPPQFGPYQLVFSPDDSRAYVTCTFSNEVRVFDVPSRTLIAVIPVGPNPLILDITPDGSLVYVANRGRGDSPSRSVSVIQTSDNMEIARIEEVGVEPHGVAITKDGKFVYVSCENLNNPDVPHHPVAGLKTPGTVAVIEVASQTVFKRIEVGAFAAGIAVLQ
ncbi:MAG: YncE family protein, partial [Bacteroidota bacterium]